MSISLLGSPLEPQGRDLPVVQVRQRVEQCRFRDDSVVAHQLDREEVGIRTVLAHQSRDEGAVTEVRVDQTFERIDQVGLGLHGMVRVGGFHHATVRIVEESLDHAHAVEVEPPVLGHPGVQDRYHRTPVFGEEVVRLAARPAR